VDRLGAELRSELAGDRLSGHAAVFERLARLPSTYEAVARSAFDGVLDDDVRALVNHNPDNLLARVGAGTLKLSTDESGLYFEIPQLPNTTYAANLREQIERGDLNGMSFGFIPGTFAMSKAPDGLQVRTHTAVKRLLDVSPVTYPAYEGTDLVLRQQTFDQTETNQSRLIKARAAVLLGRNR
jgi:HK97 family phage prohead protease